MHSFCTSSYNLNCAKPVIYKPFKKPKNRFPAWRNWFLNLSFSHNYLCLKFYFLVCCFYEGSYGSCWSKSSTNPAPPTKKKTKPCLSTTYPHLDKCLRGLCAQEASVPLKGDAVDEDKGDALQADKTDASRAKSRAKPLVQVGRHGVVEPDVVVARHHAHLRENWVACLKSVLWRKI